IISLCALVALTGAPCQGAAESNANFEQRDQRPTEKEPTELLPLQESETHGEGPKIPDEVFAVHILKFIPPTTLIKMAIKQPALYPAIKRIPRFIIFRQNL